MGASLADRCDELRDPRLVNLIVSMYGDAPYPSVCCVC